MPDAMDRVQQHAADITSDALQAHAQRTQLPGRSTCANLDCGEPISDARRGMGAQLCLDCQRAEEAAGVHFKTWRQR